MIRPLYRPDADSTPIRGTHGNAGLWYDKFCDQWRPQARGEAASSFLTMQAENSDQEKDNAKLAWIGTLIQDPVGVPKELEEATSRLIRLSQGQGGFALVFRSDSRFVTGLGRSHPVENGFAWHPTLATPYLPGSSIKGMVRAWAKQLADPAPDQAVLTRLLGEPGQSGGVCFLDAVPMAAVKLEADVLTPHTAAWSASSPPGDWRSPVPVPFLVAKEGLALLFTVVPCRPWADGDLELLQTWLIDALTWAGAGAKTAVGYGRFRLDQQKTNELVDGERQRQQQIQEALRKAERLANLDPLDRELEELAAAQPAMAPYRTWIKAVESGHWHDQPAVTRTVLDRIVTAMQQAGHWKEFSNKKNPNKDNEFKYTLRVKDLIAAARG